MGPTRDIFSLPTRILDRFIMSDFGPVTENPFRLIREGAFFIFEGIRIILRGVRIILRGVVSIIRGVLVILASLLLNIAVWPIALYINFALFIFQIELASKSLQTIIRLLGLLVNTISSSRSEVGLYLIFATKLYLSNCLRT